MTARLAGRDDAATARGRRQPSADRERHARVRLVREAADALAARAGEGETQAGRHERDALRTDVGDATPLVGDERERVVELVAQRLRVDRAELTRRRAAGAGRGPDRGLTSVTLAGDSVHLHATVGVLTLGHVARQRALVKALSRVAPEVQVERDIAAFCPT